MKRVIADIDIRAGNKFKQFWDNLTAYGDDPSKGADNYPKYLPQSVYTKFVTTLMEGIEDAASYNKELNPNKSADYKQDLK